MLPVKKEIWLLEGDSGPVVSNAVSWLGRDVVLIGAVVAITALSYIIFKLYQKATTLEQKATTLEEELRSQRAVFQKRLGKLEGKPQAIEQNIQNIERNFQALRQELTVCSRQAQNADMQYLKMSQELSTFKPDEVVQKKELRQLKRDIEFVEQLLRKAHQEYEERIKNITEFVNTKFQAFAEVLQSKKSRETPRSVIPTPSSVIPTPISSPRQRDKPVRTIIVTPLSSPGQRGYAFNFTESNGINGNAHTSYTQVFDPSMLTISNDQSDDDGDIASPQNSPSPLVQRRSMPMTFPKDKRKNSSTLLLTAPSEDPTRRKISFSPNGILESSSVNHHTEEPLEVKEHNHRSTKKKSSLKKDKSTHEDTFLSPKTPRTSTVSKSSISSSAAPFRTARLNEIANLKDPDEIRKLIKKTHQIPLNSSST